MRAGWYVLGGILVLSSYLNARQVFIVEDRSTQILRGTLSLALLFFAFLSIRKGMRDTGGQ